MNTRVETADFHDTAERNSIALPAGAGVALAVLVGSLVWMAIFAFLM